MVLTPKYRGKSPQQQKWPLGIPPINNVKQSLFKKNLKSFIALGAITFFLVIYFFTGSSSSDNSKKTVAPVVHGLYINEIPASSSLIFPQVEHAPVLKEVGVRGLYILRLEMDGSKRYVLKSEDKPLSDEEKKKTTSQVLLVKRAFLDHGKLVYRKEKSPETVIVSLIDFENSDLSSIVSVVQNRVDYAQKYNYGVYVRWIQEFIPLLTNQDLGQSGSFCKTLIMRAAMHAFPNAKTFVFVDDKSLITNFKVSVEKNILDPDVLDIAVLKGIPFDTDPNVKTYSNPPLDSPSIIIPKDNDASLMSSTFILKNDVYSKAFLEYINDPLIMNFEWKIVDKAFGHVLQWHPEILKKALIVNSKFLAADYNEALLNKKEPGKFHYTDGDFIAHFKHCEEQKNCDKVINSLYSNLKKKST